MIKWDKNDPLHREIMDACKEAFIERNAREWRAEYERLRRSLPWWARLYLKIAGWFVR